MRFFNSYCLVFILLISACSNNNDDEPKNVFVRESAIEVSAADIDYKALHFHTYQIVGDYTARLAHRLVETRNNKDWQGNIAIVSFTEFDENLQKTNALGNLISENLLGDMQVYNAPVLDLHMRGWLEVNSKGDYVYSRDSKEIEFNQNIKYVLAGVMINVDRGVKVNARIIELQTQKVVSTANILIPYFLLKNL